MILSDRSIREELAAGRIVIEPLDESAIQPSSIDVHLDRSFLVFLNHTRRVIDVKEDQRDLTQPVEIAEGEAFILHPGEFVLGSTVERITLPDDLVSRIEGKSSLARLGLLIHSSLPGSEPVMVLEDGRLVPCPIEDVVRKQRTGFVVAFDPDTFEVGYHEITGWYEGPADRIYEVELASGRTVRVTAGHNLFTLDPSGALTKVRTHDLHAGARVAVPVRIPEPPGAYGVVHVAEHVPDAAPAELTVTGPSVGRAFEAHQRSIAALLAAEGIGHVTYYERRELLPYRIARQLPGLVRGLGPDDRFGWRGSRNRVPAVIRFDDDLAWALGMFVAGGARRRGQVVFSDADPARLDRVARAVTSLGLTFHRGSTAVTVGSSVLSALLGWLGAGDAAPATATAVPPLVFGWPAALVDAFVAGVVDGAGAGSRTSGGASSSGLAGDLQVLLARLGRRSGVADDGDGDVAWEVVVGVRDTGRSETIFDLEVRPGGRKIENFLAGSGGVFVSNTAGFIDPGFSGHITLELANVATLPITLYPGMKIGQISFVRMTTPADVPYGSSSLGSKYQGQRGPTPSHYFENFRPRE